MPSTMKDDPDQNPDRGTVFGTFCSWSPVTDEPIQHGHRRMSTFEAWSPVTIPPTTMVTASKGP
jgi:hypothetical protein